MKELITFNIIIIINLNITQEYIIVSKNTFIRIIRKYIIVTYKKIV